MKKTESQTKRTERALVKLRRAALALAKSVREGDDNDQQHAEGLLMVAADAWAAAQERDYIENAERAP